MAEIEHNPNVTLGVWRSDANYATANRICTYADLVDKTLALSTEVYHEMGGESNLTNVYIINGRKTLTYQQLSHCDDVKVYLKASSSSEEQHLYRFNGAIGHLCRFSCNETDHNGVAYSYNLCVEVRDIQVIENTKDLRFRFKNITFPPILKFIPGTATDDYCTEVVITRLADQVDPHDVYMQMQNGRRAKFQFIQEPPTTFDYDSDGGIYCSSSGHPSMRYYTGGYEEYLQEFSGDCDVNYTIYDDTSTYQCVTSDPNTWNFPQFIVEPYHGNGYVTMIGKRNTPNYVEVQTDGHITVRRLNHQEWTDIDTVGYSGINQFGTIVVMPPDYSGYFTSLIPEVQEIYMSVESQSVTQWDAYKGKIYEYDENGGDEHIYEIPETDYLDLENTGYLIELTDFVGTIKYKHTYRVELNSIEAFHAITVNVNDDKFLTLKYIANETEYDVTTRQVGGHWIHTFQTVEQTNAEPKDITIKAIVNEHTCNDHPELVGNTPETTYSIVKISMAANVNPYMKGFTLGEQGVDKFVVVPYRHNSSNLPNVLNLYVRLLENIKVIFELPLGFGIRVGVNATSEGTLYKYESGDTVIGNYYKKEVPLDVEQDVFLTAGAIQVRLERYDSSLSHGYNTIRGKFYYNTTGSGEEASVIFVGTPYQFNSETSYVTLRIEGIIFALTQYYIKLEGYMETTMTIKIVLPKFLSAYSMQLEPARMPAQGYQHDVGGFISPELETSGELHDEVCVWQRTSTKIVSNEGRQSSWTAEDAETTTLKYTFSLIDRDVRFLLSSLNDRDSNYNYLPTYIFKKLQFSGGTINQWEHYTTDFTLTDNSYNVNTGSFSTPAFSGLLHNNAENPELVITAEAWERPYIYFAMKKLDVVDVNGVNVQGAAQCKAPSIVSPDGNNIVDATEVTPDTALSNFLNSLDSTYQYDYKVFRMQLPDFFKKSGSSSGNIYKEFRVRHHGNINAGQSVEGHIYPKSLNGFFYDAYIQTSASTPAWSTSGRIVSGGSTRLSTEIVWSSANGQSSASGMIGGIGTLLPWTTDPTTLNRNLLLVITPSMGDALMNIVTMKYWNGTTMKPVNYTEPIYLAPIMHTNSIEIEVNAPNTTASVKVSLDGTTFSNGYNSPIDDGHTVFAEVEQLTGVTGKTHKVTVWIDDNLYDYDESVITKPYYTNKNIILTIRYIGGSTQFDYPVNITVGPVIGFDFSAPSYISQEPNMESGAFTTKVIEYVKDGSHDYATKQIVYPTSPAYDPATGTVQETVLVPATGTWDTKYVFTWHKWSGAGSSDTFNDYFQSPNSSGNGQFTITSKSTFPSGEELIPEGTVDAVVNYTYGKLNSDAWYPNSDSDHIATASVLNFMSIGDVTWWDGSSTPQVTSLRNALLAPVAHGGTSVATIPITFRSGHGLNLHDATVHVDGPINATTAVAYENQISVNVFVTENLGDYSDTEAHRIFYTGKPIPFVLDIDDFSDTFYMKCGPVIALHHQLNSGKLGNGTTWTSFESGYLKKEVGQKTVITLRGHEWLQDASGNIIMTGQHTGGTHEGRTYTTSWQFETNAINPQTADSISPNELLPAELTDPEQGVYQFRTQCGNTNFKLQEQASWSTPTLSNRYYKDGGAWRVEIMNTAGLPNSGQLTGTVSVTDVTGSGAPEVSAMHWYDGSKTVSLNVTEGFSVVGARYLKGIDKTNPIDWQLIYEDCSSNWQNGLKLMSIDANGQGAYSFEIFIAAPVGGSFNFELLTNVSTTDSDFYDLFDVNVLVPSGGGTLPNGQHYDIIAYCNSYEDDFYILRRDYGLVGLYSDQVLQFKITGTPTGGSPIDETVNVTVCKFGLITNSLPSRMDGMVNSSELYNAYIDLVEMVSGTVQLRRYNANNTSIVKKSWDADGFTLDDYITKTYNNTTNLYMLTVDQRIPYEYNSVISQMCINEPCYDLEDFSRYMTFKLTLYLNFYTTEDPLGANFVLTPTSMSQGFYFYSSTPPSISNYTHSLTEMYKGSVKYYYATFIVESQSNGRNRIYRISQNGSPVQTGIWIASDTPDIQLTLLTITESGNVPYQYHYDNFITLRKNDPQAVSYPYTNMYALYPMTNAGSLGPYKPSISWGFNLPIGGTALSDKPFWDYSFTPS